MIMVVVFMNFDDIISSCWVRIKRDFESRQLGSFINIFQSDAFFLIVRVDADAVVFDGDLKRLFVIRYLNMGFGGLGMFDDVGQDLLNHHEQIFLPRKLHLIDFTPGKVSEIKPNSGEIIEAADEHFQFVRNGLIVLFDQVMTQKTHFIHGFRNEISDHFRILIFEVEMPL